MADEYFDFEIKEDKDNPDRWFIYVSTPTADEVLVIASVAGIGDSYATAMHKLYRLREEAGAALEALVRLRQERPNAKA